MHARLGCTARVRARCPLGLGIWLWIWIWIAIALAENAQCRQYLGGQQHGGDGRRTEAGGRGRRSRALQHHHHLVHIRPHHPKSPFASTSITLLHMYATTPVLDGARTAGIDITRRRVLMLLLAFPAHPQNGLSESSPVAGLAPYIQPAQRGQQCYQNLSTG
ncbi:hypothetical protein BOTBODRAFT_490090 [Botryobasidium botryosum FD-172 SS1]|uniref:Secreted protein n=1 Tax=Botryobasidium botryosum (strain FD-172 SS1) TaxID=930990 RepID=A0A067MG67_BOTB1|nr:hypothetical protein BOTBODRAFT_490090 [Botryobasidium botryosum FD-172 SS1]